MIIEPIAHIETPFPEKFGIPRQSGRIPSAQGKIIFEPKYRRAEALRGLAEFSHLWLIFDFSQAHRAEWSPTVRPPRLGGNTRVGVFASRSPFRPNPLGLSCVELLAIKKTVQYGDILLVGGVDLLDGTPIYDIKPYLPYADSQPNARGSYGEEHARHALEIDIPDSILHEIPDSLHELVRDILADDPRPSYQNDSDREYTVRISDWDISFFVKENCAHVSGVCFLGK